MKEDHQKPLKKLTLFFVSNLVPFNGQSYQKQKGHGTIERSSGCEKSPQKFFY